MTGDEMTSSDSQPKTVCTNLGALKCTDPSSGALKCTDDDDQLPIAPKPAATALFFKPQLPKGGDVIQRWRRMAALVAPTDNPLAAARIVEACTKIRSAMRNDLHRLARDGKTRRAKRLGREYVEHPAAKVAALHMSLRRKGVVVAHGATWSSVRVLKEAAKLDLFHDVDELVLFRPEERSNGGERHVFSFGWLEYARQHIALDVADAIVVRHPRNFSRCGVDVAAKWMLDRLPHAGLVLRTDFPDCFGQLKRDQAEARLPLPRRVTQSVLFAPAQRAKPGGLKPGDGVAAAEYADAVRQLGEWRRSTTGSAQLLSQHSSPRGASLHDTFGTAGGVPAVIAHYQDRGAPPGSALAPIAQEVVLSPLLDVLEDAATEVQAALYADDLVILVPDETAADATINALTNWSTEHFDQLVSKELRRRLRKARPQDASSWLGRSFTMHEGRAVQRVKDPEFAKHGMKVAMRMVDARDRRDLGELDAISRSLSGIMKSHAYDPRVFEFAAERLVELGELRASVNWNVPAKSGVAS